TAMANSGLKHLERSTSGAWTWEMIDPVAAAKFNSVAVAPDGTVYAVYLASVFDFVGWVQLARKSPGGAWSHADVPSHIAPSYSSIYDPLSVAVDGTGAV